ncbi:hypothetical protein DXG03_005643 [Asterophora parasitica]|uniref:Fungal-type protein kinase domain-containing protein n=1 Tax=Asterophora parasitica TaxID=117018 RepID=A0A9P7GED7_9AGAR|nr:hypothetical protein DXG03_005643 [Asterophora parasitica]
MGKRKNCTIARLANFAKGAKTLGEKLSPRKKRRTQENDEDKENQDTTGIPKEVVRKYRGHRVLPESILQELDAAGVVRRKWTTQLSARTVPLTTLSGASFMKAWFQLLKSNLKAHAIMWSKGMKHGDISLRNIACEPIAEQGVLLDFDLAIPEWPHPRVVGTLPFMAVDLLRDEYMLSG